MSSALTKSFGSRQLLLVQQCRNLPKNNLSRLSKTKKIVLGTSAAVVGGAGAITAVAFYQTANAADLELHPPSFPWNHKPLLSTLDMASVRRGFEVYQQVCAACHSLKYIAFRNLVGTTHTEAEAKALAAEALITDGPNDDGKMFQRPGKLSDYLPSPYANDEEARKANNGALPPDLSYIVLGRHGEEDYVFSLLTGYCDPPAGVTVEEDQHYNPYFAGQKIGMAQALYDEIIEYQDGTPATQSQLAKDVSIFLRWASEPYHDTKKLYGFRTLLLGAIFLPMIWYHKKRVFSMIKSKKLAYKP